MDYGGPFLVKEHRRRNAQLVKIYLALFICMSIKAVHFEIVTGLSTDAFLAALDRFVRLGFFWMFQTKIIDVKHRWLSFDVLHRGLRLPMF